MTLLCLAQATLDPVLRTGAMRGAAGCWLGGQRCRGASAEPHVLMKDFSKAYHFELKISQVSSLQSVSSTHLLLWNWAAGRQKRVVYAHHCKLTRTRLCLAGVEVPRLWACLTSCNHGTKPRCPGTPSAWKSCFHAEKKIPKMGQVTAAQLVPCLTTWLHLQNVTTRSLKVPGLWNLKTSSQQTRREGKDLYTILAWLV